MKSTSNRNAAPACDDPEVARLEVLVDELIKDNPREAQVRAFMEEAGLVYSHDPIDRMNRVLTALNKRRKGGDHGKSI